MSKIKLKLVPEIIEDDCEGCFFNGSLRCPNVCNNSILVPIDQDVEVFEFEIVDGKYIREKE